jgi:hypothetical protein
MTDNMTKNTKTIMSARRFAVFAIAVFMLTACMGCVDLTTVYNLEVNYEPGAAPAPTLPCPVALSLSKEFTSYEHVSGGVDRWRAPFGPALRKYAIYVAQSVFGDIQVLEGQPPRGDVKLLLVPRVTSSDLQSFEIASGALGVQWDFNDPKTGQTLFTMHVQCETTRSYQDVQKSIDMGRYGLIYVTGDLMTQLTSMTLQRVNAAKELQRLSGH